MHGYMSRFDQRDGANIIRSTVIITTHDSIWYGIIIRIFAHKQTDRRRSARAVGPVTSDRPLKICISHLPSWTREYLANTGCIVLEIKPYSEKHFRGGWLSQPSWKFILRSSWLNKIVLKSIYRGNWLNKITPKNHFFRAILKASLKM